MSIFVLVLAICFVTKASSSNFIFPVSMSVPCLVIFHPVSFPHSVNRIVFKWSVFVVGGETRPE